MVWQCWLLHVETYHRNGQDKANKGPSSHEKPQSIRNGFDYPLHTHCLEKDQGVETLVANSATYPCRALNLRSFIEIEL